jgi:hypothetical protein
MNSVIEPTKLNRHLVRGSRLTGAFVLGFLMMRFVHQNPAPQRTNTQGNLQSTKRQAPESPLLSFADPKTFLFRNLMMLAASEPELALSQWEEGPTRGEIDGVDLDSNVLASILNELVVRDPQKTLDWMKANLGTRKIPMTARLIKGLYDLSPKDALEMMKSSTIRAYFTSAKALISHAAEKAPKEAVKVIKELNSQHNLDDFQVSSTANALFKNDVKKGTEFLRELLTEGVPPRLLRTISVPSGMEEIGFNLKLQAVGGANSECLLRSINLTNKPTGSWAGGTMPTDGLRSDFLRWREREPQRANEFLNSLQDDFLNNYLNGSANPAAE